ncbi:NAD-dependent succinate-semialdehyde dehydrogenase [Nocardioides sp.]|uniref:NAD-dependent succinate-semialdehyde dehydrogenase n=1 Tax=Nocardioides sp. TaxID=35761 RepID=UPI0035159670
MSHALITVEDPATLEVVGTVPDHTVDDGLAAVARASQAFGAWAATSPRARSEVLRRAFDLMIERRDELAELIARENGKSLADAAAEVTYAAEFFRWFSEEAVRTDGDFGSAPAGGTRTIVHHRPVGVAALVTPWNFPAAMATRKIGPALAAGCTVVLKPAAETPLTAIAVADILREAGLPDGVVEVVTTTDASGVVGAWLADARVRKVSFTGSTNVGRILLRQAAERVVNSSMELGGNAPFIVGADADLEAAIAGVMIAKFRNAGQACTAANRLYVHRDVVEEFTARLAAEVEKLTVGAARDGAAIGPMISAAAVERITRTVDDAVAAGARVVARAAVPDPAELPGHFYPPTVIVDVAEGDPLVSEEIFGPVAPIRVWDDEDALLAEVNASEYGLAAYVYDRDLQRALQLAERLDAGMVGINRGLVSDPAAPFGGVKQSGLGREGAREGLAEFTETQYFSVDWGR